MSPFWTDTTFVAAAEPTNYQDKQKGNLGLVFKKYLNTFSL